MSGVLHPVGPEPAATYWLRRVLVLAVLAVVLIVVIALVRMADRPQQAVPAPAASGSPSVSSSGLTSSPTAEASTAPSAPDASVSATGSPAATPQPTPSPAAPVFCLPAAVRISLTGAQSLKPREPDVFHLSLVNASGASCRVQVSGQTFELRISSGRDRIWTTRHCPRLVRPVNQVLTGGQSVGWNVSWNGLRSAPGCRSRPEVPKAGTYVAAAKLAGVRAVRLRVMVNG